MQTFKTTNLCKVLFAGGAVFSIAACSALVEHLNAQPVSRIAAQQPDQACDAPEQNEDRLAGALLRNSEASGDKYVPMLISGRENRVGFDPDLKVNDDTQIREIDEIRGTLFQRIKDSGATLRKGFGPAGALPNVYDVSYSSSDIALRGPLVAGPGSYFYEVPSSGATVFTGKIGLEIITQSDSGEKQSVRTEGRFELRAGYGSGRGSLTASGFDAALPFDVLTWSKLFLCGTRFISSGTGVVTVQNDGSPGLSPFKASRDPASFRALFESSLFAPVERPAPPISVGGVFVIQSDNGTMTAVFLSDQAEEEDADG